MQIPARVFKLLEVMLGHELKKLLDLLYFRVGKRWAGLCRLFAFHAVLKFDEMPRRAGQHFRTAGVDGHVVFNANAPYAFRIHARFNRNYVS